MRLTRRSRWVVPVVAAAALGLTLTACTGDEAANDAADTDCTDYGGLRHVRLGHRGQHLRHDPRRRSRPAQRIVGRLRGLHRNRRRLRGLRPVRRAAQRAHPGRQPARPRITPQPGLVARLASQGALVPAPDSVAANVSEFWSEDWAAYGTVDGTLYGSPLMASIKGYIWYSPSMFEENGWEVPDTLDGLTALTADIRDSGAVDKRGASASPRARPPDGPAPTGSRTSCSVSRAPTSTTSGSRTRSRSTTRRSPTRSTRWATSSAPTTTSTADSATCARSRRPTSATRAFRSSTARAPCTTRPRSTRASGPRARRSPPDGGTSGRSCFPEPRPTPMRSRAAARSSRRSTTTPEVVAVQTYLSSDTWANNRVSLGGVISANSGLDPPENASSELLKNAVEQLQDPDTVFRFDASDLMPAAVGSGSFWQGDGRLDRRQEHGRHARLHRIELAAVVLAHPRR